MRENKTLNTPSNTLSNTLSKGIGFLAIIGLVCAGLLAATDRLTAQRIAHNAQTYEARLITSLVGVQPTTAPQWVDDVWSMCNGLVLVRAQTRGYGGPMSALVAREGEQLRGLRVTAHQETPGIADFVSQPDHPWHQRLLGRSAANLPAVDAIAGATISSRALVTLVAGALQRPVPQGRCL